MDDYEAKSEEIRAANEPLLTAFRKHLLGSGLGKKTVERHVGNIDFFGNALFHEFAERGVPVPTRLLLGFRLVRGQPRSLIGSQNDMIYHASHHMAEPGASFEGVGNKLNGMPMSAIEEIFPGDAFTKALAEDPPFEPPPPGNIVSFPSLN